MINPDFLKIISGFLQIANLKIFYLSLFFLNSAHLPTFVPQIIEIKLFAMSLDNKILYEALTYDDVLLLPGYSKVLPRDTDTSSNLTRNIRLNIPVVSAAMDTVTESSLAISMALEGGLGFIHKNMTIKEQANQVRKVKRSQSGMILDPITLDINARVEDANSIMSEFKIGGIPVIDKVGKLIGIITNRDLRFIKDMSLPVKDIMTSENVVTAGEGCSLL